MHRISSKAWKVQSSLLCAAIGSIVLICPCPRISSAEEEQSRWWWTTRRRGATNSTSTTITSHSIPTDTPSTPTTNLSRLAPASPIRIFRPNPFLEIAFDVRTRNPVYVLEQLQPAEWTKGRVKHKRPHFYEEKTLPDVYRSRNSYYRGTEYDRGHLAPAGDFSYNQELLTDTFNLCNTSPQVGALNRKAWANLEEWVRRVAEKAHVDSPLSTTYVLTGPLWLPSAKLSDKVFTFNYPAIGQPPALQSVPTHFFKVIVVVANDAIQQFCCLVVPNHESCASLSDWRTFCVPWTALETVSGLELFPALTNTPRWKETADALSYQIQGTNNGILLLKGGSGTSKGSTASQRTKRALQKEQLQHLCAGGKCQHPYK